jgi:hypothetical protein
VEWCALVSTASGLGPVAGFCEYGDETWGFLKGGELLD